MTEVYIILNKVLVKEFYRLNVGFFLLTLTVSFGVMSGTEHKAMAEFFIASPVILLIPIMIWIIYMIKILNFNISQLHKKENQILFEISLLKRPEQVFQFFLALAGQFLPAMLYAGFIITIAIKHDRILPIAIIIVSVQLLLTIGTAIMVWRTNHIQQEIKISSLKTYLDRRFTKSLYQFYMGWILKREPLLTISTKFFSGLLIFAVTHLYIGELYDWRLLAMGATLAFSGNFMLISQIHVFENYHFKLLRNLPIVLLKRMLTYLCVFLIFSLPEITVLLRNFPLGLDWFDALSTILYGISIGLLYYCLHFIADLQKNGFTQLIFGSVIFWIVLILFSVPLFIIIAINIMISIIIYKKCFYIYEYNTTDLDE